MDVVIGILIIVIFGTGLYFYLRMMDNKKKELERAINLKIEEELPEFEDIDDGLYYWNTRNLWDQTVDLIMINKDQKKLGLMYSPTKYFVYNSNQIKAVEVSVIVEKAKRTENSESTSGVKINPNQILGFDFGASSTGSNVTETELRSDIHLKITVEDINMPIHRFYMREHIAESWKERISILMNS